MSSKRKKNQGENNGSSRNLDGRRLRTVTEAKVLAEYLAIKPNMEQKEKEARRKRWEQVVEIAEKKEEALKSASRGRVDGQWAEDREETVERTREAVTSAIKNGNYKDISFSKPEDASASSTSDSDEHPTRIENNPNQESLSKPRDASRSFYGFDDDDEFMSDDSSDADDSEESEEGGTGQA